MVPRLTALKIEEWPRRFRLGFRFPGAIDLLTRRKNFVTLSSDLTGRLERVEAQIADVISAARKCADDWSNASVRLAGLEENLEDLRVKLYLIERRLDKQVLRLRWLSVGLGAVMIVVAGISLFLIF